MNESVEDVRIKAIGAKTGRLSMIRVAKCALMSGVTLFFSLVVFNNTTDFDSNYQFVRHVMLMDSTFPGNHGLWRAIAQPRVHVAFYLSIIVWETLTCVLCWWGLSRLVSRMREPAAVFDSAKSVAIGALTLGCMLWFVAFIDVGGEWFLMWQSKMWNGQDAAFRMFVVLGLTLIFLAQPETEILQ